MAEEFVVKRNEWVEAVVEALAGARGRLVRVCRAYLDGVECYTGRLVSADYVKVVMETYYDDASRATTIIPTADVTEVHIFKD